ncbi:sulfite exporter TauE/SafE family protein [Labilibacter marinus]|uniref:sulfite exporter TauE/SafE family protein n=1 Tax=Labilibacter marinus TaxID=1477105 RepID=UPI0008298F68|nr:sulfite exporter TauE/SafE family protein [Labilibacter marinus]
MSILEYILLILAGLASGFINVIAGGGSLLTLPLMIFLGVPSVVANASNRVAILAQNIVSVSNFKKNKVLSGMYPVYLGVSALFGAIIGAYIAVDIPEKLLNKILSIVMVIVGVLILTSPTFKADQKERLDFKNRFIGVIVFFFVGIYGGFLQAGIGFVMILSLVKINRFSLLKTNAIKVTVALIYTISALAVFIWQDVVDWNVGLTVAVGSATGGWLGSHFSIKKGDVWIKRFLLVAIVVMAIKLWLF